MITVITHDATVGQVNDLIHRLYNTDIAEGLLYGEYSLVLTHEDGFLVVGLDELPTSVKEMLKQGLFEIERPLWYWCSIDILRDAVKDCLYRRWLHDT